jgi:bifunctional DNA-binding transcriptional regulator/antitoxin component of YhaV-PrlF toxin-antitoxin module
LKIDWFTIAAAISSAYRNGVIFVLGSLVLSPSCSKDSILDTVRIMPKVTSKLQLTVPKAIADLYGIRPGDVLEWIPAGESIRVQLVTGKTKARHELTSEERLAIFDANTKWLDEIQAAQLKEEKAKGTRTTRENRGWTRDELYEDERGLPRGYPR